MAVTFDELGLWIYFSDIADGPARVIEIPVGWPTWERRRFAATGQAPEAPSGVLRIQGVMDVRVDRSGGYPTGWETLALWQRTPGRLEIAHITRVIIDGNDLRAELTLWDEARPSHPPEPAL